MAFRKGFVLLTLAAASLSVFFIMTGKTAFKSDINNVNPKRPPDFFMYYTGATLAQERGLKNLYDVELQKEVWDQVTAPLKMEGLLVFRAPPLVAFLLKPLADLSYTNSFNLLIIINTLLIAVIVATYYKTKSVDKKVWLHLLLALPLFLPIWSNIHSGQLSLFILWFLALAYLLLTNHKFFSAGLVLGLVFIKPQFLTVIPLVVALYIKNRRIKKLLLGLGLSLFAMLMANVFVYGIEFITKYPVFLFTSETVSHGTNPFFNYNISSMLTLVIDNHKYVNILNLGINTALYAGLLFFLVRKNARINKSLAFAAVVMFGPLINLHSMPVDIVVFHLPLYIVSSYLYKKGEFRKMCAFAGIMLLLPWGAYLYLNVVTTIVFILVAVWILEKSCKPDVGAH